MAVSWHGIYTDLLNLAGHRRIARAISGKFGA
jgi:hypothetical protein